MTVVYQTKEYAAGLPWIASASSTPDSHPGAFLNERTTAWVNAIADPTKIRIERDYTNAASYVSSNSVRILLNTPEVCGAQAGIQWFSTGAEVSTGTASAALYHTWTAGSSNNGYGLFTTYGTGRGWRPSPATSITRMFIAYEADVALPWIGVSIQSSLYDSYAAILSRVDSSNTSNVIYGPFQRLGKWCVSNFSSGTPSSTAIPMTNATTPIEGMASGGNQDGGGFTLWTPPTASATGSATAVFPSPVCTSLGAYAGTINPTCGFVTGGSVDPWTPETLTLFGKTYRKATRNLWIRIA